MQLKFNLVALEKQVYEVEKETHFRTLIYLGYTLRHLTRTLSLEIDIVQGENYLFNQSDFVIRCVVTQHVFSSKMYFF